MAQMATNINRNRIENEKDTERLEREETKNCDSSKLSIWVCVWLCVCVFGSIIV